MTVTGKRLVVGKKKLLSIDNNCGWLELGQIQPQSDPATVSQDCFFPATNPNQSIHPLDCGLLLPAGVLSPLLSLLGTVLGSYHHFSPDKDRHHRGSLGPLVILHLTIDSTVNDVLHDHVVVLEVQEGGRMPSFQVLQPVQGLAVPGEVEQESSAGGHCVLGVRRLLLAADHRAVVSTTAVGE
jgi:hypothetical protein